MRASTIEPYRHEHVFLGSAHAANERRTQLVVALTALTMVVEIVTGSIFGSMALIADGLHMTTHVTALGTAAVAYRYARLHRHDPRFSFGTGKLGELTAFASAIALLMVALLIGVDSVSRLIHPLPVAFGEAIPIAALGLVVNLASARLLHPGDHHHDDHRHHHHAHRHHGDLEADTNYRAAYLHVAADALTSLLALAALTAGLMLGWAWLDPTMGLVGTAVIIAWSVGLIKGAATTLLDMVPDPSLADRIRLAIERDGDLTSDLHVWRVGPGHTAVIVTVVTETSQQPTAYRRRLENIEGLSHVTIEIERREPVALRSDRDR